MSKAALISVTDKEGVVEFAHQLSALGYKILSSSGTAQTLKKGGVEVILVEDYTGQKEILDGRVKTLHPKIHAGILADRSDPEHMAQLEADGIWPIDLVVVNLYPFLKKVKEAVAADPAKMVQYIDIGGPAMLRGASKNHTGVLPVIDPSDYPSVIEALTKKNDTLAFRRHLATKVFMTLANYDLEISRYYANFCTEENEATIDAETGPVAGMVLIKAQDLRYGENPHQKARLYHDLNQSGVKPSWTQLHGKELSYNNLLDFDAALRIVRDLQGQPAVAIFKHLNPCGVGRSDNLLKALHLAKRGDPRSHFGGVIGFTDTVTKEVAEELNEGFVEIVIAPKFNSEARDVLFKKKNLRIIEVDLTVPPPTVEARIIQDGVLIQHRDNQITKVEEGKVVSKRKPIPSELDALNFAWIVCSHVKSNAIVATNQEMILSVGAGQMSRVDSAELLISRAKLHGNNLSGGVAASDAFFPFPDSVEHLINAGITFLVAPSGASRDQEVIDTVDRLGAGLIFMNERHFRH